MSDQSEREPLRIGILGTAKIARDFVSGVKGSSKLTVASIASRDQRRARDFAEEFKLPNPCGSYEQLLAMPEIDAIYNPLPNSLHAEWSIKAAEAGKHILCEKPLAVSGKEAAAMIQAARRAGVYLVEAYPYRSQPLTDKLKSLLAAGEIGEVKLIRGDFGITMTNQANIRLNPALRGGSLWDLGCYPISLVTMVAKDRPRRVYAASTWTSSGVTDTLAAILEFSSGLIAQISSSFSTVTHRNAMIAGSRGNILTEYQNHTESHTARLQLKRGNGASAAYETIMVPAGDGFLFEAESFVDLVRLGPAAWNGVSNEESIDIALTLEAIEESARRGTPIEIPARQ